MSDTLSCLKIKQSRKYARLNMNEVHITLRSRVTNNSLKLLLPGDVNTISDQCFTFSRQISFNNVTYSLQNFAGQSYKNELKN